jgi:hypothetical protein
MKIFVIITFLVIMFLQDPSDGPDDGSDDGSDHEPNNFLELLTFI